MLEVKSHLTRSGMHTNVLGRKYFIRYNTTSWKNYKNGMKNFLLDNLPFLGTFHLPMIFDENKIKFNTAEPLMKPWVYQMMIKYIPYSTDADKISTSQFLMKFINLEFDFEDYNMKLPESDFEPDEKALINFTFGKESLVTLGICDEIGLDNDLIYFETPSLPIETKIKRRYSKVFSKKLNKNIVRVNTNFYDLCDATNFNKPDTEWGYGSELTQYAMHSLPIVDANKIKFVIFGNEKSCNDFYINSEGYRSYPVFDQTSDWTIELSNLMKIITNNKTGVFSIVEPINELAVIKILHNRYKNLGQFQFSCFPDNYPPSPENQWCHMCTKCARIFVFLKAIGVDVKNLGFRENLFNEKYARMFSLFNGTTKHGIPYDDSGLNRDELLFAFYLAYKRGETGPVIQLFKQKYLDEAKEREDELYKKFFGVFNSKTMPGGIKNKVISIFKEELNNGF